MNILLLVLLANPSIEHGLRVQCVAPDDLFIQFGDCTYSDETNGLAMCTIIAGTNEYTSFQLECDEPWQYMPLVDLWKPTKAQQKLKSNRWVIRKKQ